MLPDKYYVIDLDLPEFTSGAKKNTSRNLMVMCGMAHAEQYELTDSS